MEKLKMHSPNLVEQNIEKLAALFPNCVTESKGVDGKLQQAIDFDLLKQELSRNIVEGPQERYQLNWPGKREALLTANAPIAKTLRPCREESVNFDTTQNLFIEGDNLDALKLLQETYLGKIKMIYIDPPYNTGNDFIYNDDFAEDTDSYISRSNQRDSEDNRLITNTETNGRFHSMWLSMIYSRLRLAKNMLSEEGLIFISIDDNEISGVRQICDEIFGTSNFIGQIVWEKMYTTKNDSSQISVSHEYIVCYSKNPTLLRLGSLPRTAEMDARYTNTDNDPRGPWKAIPLYADGERKNGRFIVSSPTGKKHEPQPNTHWRYAEDEVVRLISDNRIYFGKNGDAQPTLKRFLSELNDGVKAKTLWFHKDVGSNDSASREIKELFSMTKSPINFPKPTSLICRMLQLGAFGPDDIVLDFFAGSSTTAHAVMKMNACDGNNRKFIMIQLPEACDDKSDSYTAGYSTIAELSKKRIKLAGERVSSGDVNIKWNKDVGFRVLKIDSSNMSDVYYNPDAILQTDLFTQVENVKEDRTEEDLLFQVMLDWGVDLSLPIYRETIDDKIVFFVDAQPDNTQGALVACFDKTGGINEAFIKQLAAFNPLRLVFRDAGFSSDATKINVEQLLKQLSPTTDVKTI
ncbi:site-specific DNA-methyltransferase [Yersinia enterocolitica]|uniref:site-specific DNA-methyltransferase n=1 Tax=Yersinia enterocolitica TaxID=630 RepID=UPI003148E5C8